MMQENTVNKGSSGISGALGKMGSVAGGVAKGISVGIGVAKYSNSWTR